MKIFRGKNKYITLLLTTTNDNGQITTSKIELGKGDILDIGVTFEVTVSGTKVHTIKSVRLERVE